MRSIQKYCSNGEFCIATGDGTTFTMYYFQEMIPFLEVDDTTYWLVDKSLKPSSQPIVPIAIVNTPVSIVNEPLAGSGAENTEEEIIRKLESIIISGKVPFERYTELFNYFITPFAMRGNKIDIEISFTIKSMPANPLDESNPQYKSAKEAAKQLGLCFEEQ